MAPIPSTTTPLSQSHYESTLSKIHSSQTSRSKEYNTLYSSSSVFGSIMSSSQGGGGAPQQQQQNQQQQHQQQNQQQHQNQQQRNPSYDYPNVDDMSAVRSSLQGKYYSTSQSIWGAARETSQSLEFDVYGRGGRGGGGGGGRRGYRYDDDRENYEQQQHNLPPPPMQQQQQQSQKYNVKQQQAQGQGQIDLERRMMKLENENASLRKSIQDGALLSKSITNKSLGGPVTTSSGGGGGGGVGGNEDESEILKTLRASVQTSLTQLSTMESKRSKDLVDARKKLSDSKKEVERIKSVEDKIRADGLNLSELIKGGGVKGNGGDSDEEGDGLKVRVSRPKLSSSANLSIKSRNPNSAPSPRRTHSPTSKKTDPPKIEINATRASKLREEKRNAERAAQSLTTGGFHNTSLLNTSGAYDDDSHKLSGLADSNLKVAWSTMGPPPVDNGKKPSRVSRQRDAGLEAYESNPRVSKDYTASCLPNTEGASTIITAHENGNKALDWGVLMGVEAGRKALLEKENGVGVGSKDDPTYEEVIGIVSHCRKADRMTHEVIALLPTGDDRVTVPKEASKKYGDNITFKKKISTLMIQLKSRLESNAEKLVKYVSFKERCNLHTKDLEGILSRRALSTLAYAHGAVNTPHLDATSFEVFLRAFWSDRPLLFPIDSLTVLRLWSICDAGDTLLLAEMIFVQPYIERTPFGFEFTQHCWGQKRSGMLKLRSAGFEKLISEEEIPARVNYGYCKSTVSPPEDWDVGDITRGTEVPKPELELERCYGCLGKTICPNLYETHDGCVIFTVAAVAVVMHVESGQQKFYNNHTDDITCLTVHYAGKLAATGQMGKPCYLLVWSIETLETMYRIGDGYYDRMVEALSISPNERYLVGVGGDNSQTLAVWDLQALDEVGDPCPKLMAEAGFTPGVPPMMTFLEWKPGLPGVTFVGVSKGRTLKFYDFEPEKGTAPSDGVPATGQMLTDRKGIPPRECRELVSAAWAMDGSCLVTGTDYGDVLVWTGISITNTISAVKHVKGREATVSSNACTALAFTPAGDKLYAGYQDGKMLVWSFPDAEVLDVHNMALSRSELATKCGGRSTVAALSGIVKKKRDKGIPGAPKEVQAKEKGVPGGKAVINIVVLDNKKVVKDETEELEEKGYEQVVIGTERGMLLNVWDDKDGETQFKSLMAGHYGNVSGLGPHPIDAGVFATVGEDAILNIWSAHDKKCIKTSELTHPARSVCFSPDGLWIAVGYCDGYMGIYDTELLRERVEHHTLREDIDCIKWSPDGRYLAAGSHDNYIDIFDCGKGFKFRNRFKGHTSYITHLDFSADSRMLMTNCGASEILYWDVRKGKQLRTRSDMPADPNDWSTWGRMTCVLGFGVMGIWPDFSDGTDVNALHVNEKGDTVVTADDFGEVKLFNFPCVTEDASFRAYRGHSSFVNNVSFVKGDTHVISCGSADLTVMQWKFVYARDVLKPLKDAVKMMKGLKGFGKGEGIKALLASEKREE